MTGKIIKGISGFYYVLVAESGLYECKARGIFRKDGIKPLVGDDVEIEVTDEANKKGNVIDILPRKSQLIRPAVANVDQALVIFAVSQPDPNLNLLDRFLVMMSAQDMPVTICFNKNDLGNEEFEAQMRDTYEKAGYTVMFTVASKGLGIEEIKNFLKGKTTTVAGPSGVGKSSIINLLTEEESMETGSVSDKIGRGKHTTRHSELLAIDEDTFIMDTPGFSSIFVPDCQAQDLWEFFPDFLEPAENCRFIGCAHHKEPSCGVKDAVEEGLIAKTRYENYLQMYLEMKDTKKY